MGDEAGNDEKHAEASIGLCGIEIGLDGGNGPRGLRLQSDCVELKFGYRISVDSIPLASIGLCGIEIKS